MSMLTLNSVVYTLDHFLNVIKATDLKYEITNWSVSDLVVDFTCDKVIKTLVFRISNDDTIQSFLNKELKMSLYPTIDKVAMIPIMNDESVFSKIDSEILYIEADIISISFILLSRYEETLVKERDSHGRFQFKNSLGKKYEFHKFPIVDEYCYLLKEQLKSLFFNIKFEEKKVKIIPTHDIDEIQRFKGVYKSAKSIFEDLYVYGSFKFFLNSIKSYFISSINPFKDMYLLSIYKLIEVSKKNGYVSEFYFMGADSGNNNDGYDCDSTLLKNVFAEIEQNKMIAGLHGGYMTYLDVNIFNSEKLRVENAINTPIKHNRQHYLRFDIEHTFEVLEKSNIGYDSTLGYAEEEGFRCGTCHPYHPYDFKNDNPYEIWEKPLIVMDVTLSGYQKYNEIEALASMQQLYERCKVVEGDFVLLWHNNYVYREPSYFKNVYCKFLELNKAITA